MLEFEFGCAEGLSEQQVKIESLISVFMLGDARISVISMGLEDKSIIIRLASACTDIECFTTRYWVCREVCRFAWYFHRDRMRFI